jgi:DNA invertase Pin-like site-specific DNA recombinase
MKRAVAYCRVSGESQASGGGGVDRQREKIAVCAAARGFEIADADWYEDLGVCGANDLKDRPGLGALLMAVEHNGFEVVFIEKLDRLARDLVLQERLISDFRGRGFKLISADEGDDLMADAKDPSRKMIRQILGAVAEFDKDMIVLKLAAGRARKKRLTGRCEGRQPYGSGKNAAAETEIADQVRLFRKAGASYQTIADYFNEKGIKPREGKKWYASTARCADLAGEEKKETHE